MPRLLLATLLAALTLTAAAQPPPPRTTTAARAPAPTPPSAPVARARPPPRADVALYGESLCPDTAAYVVRVLAPLLEAGVVGAGNASTAAEFRFVAYGNAKPAAGGGIECQHGKKECDLNRALACAQDMAPDAFPSILTCYFGGDLTSAGLDTCLTTLGGAAATPVRVSGCATGDKGAALEAAARADTEALPAPKKNFVPWVVVDGVALAAACGDTGRYACVAAAARGAKLPAGCAAAAAAAPARCPGAPTAAAVMPFGR